MTRNYFGTHETQCRCGCGADITSVFRAELNELREYYGKPMVVNSGMRCEAHNKSIGGSPKSQHMEGRAVDIRVDNTKDAARLVGNALKLGFTVGVYEWGCHLDRRPYGPILFRGP